MAPLHLADDVHDLALTRAIAALVDDRERRIVEPLGERTRADHAADIGADHHQILIAVARLDIRRHHRRGVEIVGRDVEKALDLAGMQIDREHAVGPCFGDQIGDQLGRDRGPRPGLAVLPCVAEIGHNCGDPPGRCAPQRIDADQQFHQIVIGGIAGRLDHEHILAAHVLVDLDEDLLVGEAPDAGIDQRHLEIGRDRAGERQVRIGGHDFHANESLSARCRCGAHRT